MNDLVSLPRSTSRRDFLRGVRCGSSIDGKFLIGVQVVCAPWREDICLAVASYLESRSGGWQRPPI